MAHISHHRVLRHFVVQVNEATAEIIARAIKISSTSQRTTLSPFAVNEAPLSAMSANSDPSVTTLEESAKAQAKNFRSNVAGPEHILLAMTNLPESYGARVLSDMGVSLERIRADLTYIIDRGDAAIVGEISLSWQAIDALENAAREAARLGHSPVGTEHVLLGLLVRDRGVAAGVLSKHHVTLVEARTAVADFAARNYQPKPPPEAPPEPDQPRPADVKSGPTQQPVNPPISVNPKAIKFFYSYSRIDKDYLEQLQTFMAMIRLDYDIDEWHDDKIPAGRPWRREIEVRLDAADIILLLVSPAFLKSKYCDIETERALKRLATDRVEVIPIILTSCDWQDTPLGDLQALPKGSIPIDQWPTKSAGWLNVIQEIRLVIERLHDNALASP